MLLNACAVCLTTDVKFYDMDVGHLRQDYNLVSGLTTHKGNGLPGYLCFECTAYLRRCKQFRDKCHRAHYALTQVLYDQKEITKVALKIIHRRLIDILPSLAYADSNRKHYEEVMFQCLEHNHCNMVKGEIPIVDDSLQGSIEIEVPSYNTNPNIVSVKTECDDTSFETDFSLDLPNLDDGPKDDLFVQTIKKEPEFSNVTNVFQEFFASNAQECDYVDRQCKEESVLNTENQEGDASNLDQVSTNMVPTNLVPTNMVPINMVPTNMVPTNVEESKAAVGEIISQHVCEVCMKTFISENRLKAHMRMHDKIAKPSMDENNQLDDETIRKRKLANACLKRHRKKKREEAQLQKLLAQKEQDSEQTQQNTLERRRELARERSKRYRDKKRLSCIQKIEHAIDDTLITNSPIVMNDYSVNTGASENNCAGSSRRNNRNNVIQLCVLPDEGSPMNVVNNSTPLQIQTHESVASTPQSIRSSTYSSYARHSGAHAEFHRQFTQNSFGHACKICDRLWFMNDLKSLNDVSMNFVTTFLPNVGENSIAVCSTCRTSVQKKSIPSMAVCNGFEYPISPSNLRNFPLDLVSERLISPRVPFVQIRRLRNIDGQYGIYGQVINVPIDINTMVNTLPRDISDDHCINVQIERRKIHKSKFLHGLVNKRTIEEWLRYLVNTELYKTYDITIDDRVLDNLQDDRVDSDEHDDNYWNEFTENIPIEESLLAQQETLMWNDNLYLNIAPGENIVPVGLLFEEHAEELSFPSIYLGQSRQFREGVKVTPFIIASSELRRSDRRGVTPHHLLYMAMKIMRIRVRDSLRVAFKHVGKNSNVTKEQIQSEDYIHGCVESNLAFLRSIPNSAWYWSEKRKDLFAMIRQLGRPTVFFTISANEIGWLDLLQLLYRLNKHDSITKEAVAKLDCMVKSTLINEDAVTCAIYFNKLINVIMNILQSKKCSPFGKFRVRHYFKSIEFQHQGSPRANILAWLDNAPSDALNDDYDKAIELIDALTSVDVGEASGNIKHQMHKHTSTCFGKISSNEAQKCRSDAPFMPCKKTMILCPMKDSEEGFTNYRKRYAQIRVALENEDFADIDDFFSRNGINSDDDYLNIIRAGITRTKVLVRRDPSEKWHNPYNPFILNIVKSNIDFQFIADDYACAAYLVENTNKRNRGVSDLRRKIIDTVNEHPESDIIEITKMISVNILNHTEITCQEAAWYLLREPTCKSSLSIVYLATVWPAERQRLRKTIEDLSKLEDDCTDVWKENWFDRYEKRPEHLEGVTLAQFVSRYTRNKNGVYVERDVPRIVRYRNYDISSDYQEYKREMVTLHLPYRSEEVEVLAEMRFISLYDDNESIILQRRKEFESNIDIGRTIQICRELDHEV